MGALIMGWDQALFYAISGRPNGLSSWDAGIATYPSGNKMTVYLDYYRIEEAA